MKARRSHIFEREENDHYVEPLALDEALIDYLSPSLEKRVILDPCCGWGRIPRAAASRGITAFGYDLEPRWEDSPDGPLPGAVHVFKADGLLELDRPGLADCIDAVIFNPPYGRAERFIRTALFSGVQTVAAILPLTWIAGARRSAWLKESGLSTFMPIVPRPSMPSGPHIAAGGSIGGGTKDFAVLIWDRGNTLAPAVEWLNWRTPAGEASDDE